MESCVSGDDPLIDDAIRIVPHSTAPASNSDSSLRHALLRRQPRQERIENDLADDEPPVAAADVLQMRIPFAEQVIGPLVRRVQMVVGPQIDGHFIHQFQRKMGVFQVFARQRLQQFERLGDDGLVGAVDDAGIADEQRKRPQPFMRIRLHPPSVLQHGDRAVAEKIVQLVERAGGDPLRLVPRAALLQHGFDDAAQKEGVLKVGVVEVE